MAESEVRAVDPAAASGGGSRPVFEVRGLTKSYGSTVVLQSLDFDVMGGEAFVILGRSGSGKSVTLRQLNGLERPDAGTVRFDGVEISALQEHELYPYRRRIGMLFQSGALFDSMTVAENVAFPLRQHTPLGADEIDHQVREKLALVGLDGVEEKLPSALSGGMRKRAALARALTLAPEVLLFDEPTTGLDPMTSATIAHLIDNVRQRLQTTVVVVTHDLSTARTVATRLAFLDEGRFRFLGTWEEASSSRDPVLGRFLTGQREEAGQ
jgi:phospholipid/cholesterol/gamma-HCH transport system ATP-binding protein